MFNNPFASSTSKAGHGHVKVSTLPPASSVLEQVSYQYPLKLIAPSPITVQSEGPDEQPILVHTVFLLTYGGGLVGGDAINLHIDLASATRLSLLTQGSTKVFNSPQRSIITRQDLIVHLQSNSSLCYLPDPVQPFGESVFEQRQTYHLLGKTANLCVCDWVSEGRTARGEQWSFYSYISRNEVWHAPVGDDQSKKRLLLRDNLILEQDQGGAGPVAARMHGIGVFGTLLVCGPLFQKLADFFMDEFRSMPRIGARQWDKPDESIQLSAREKMRVARLDREAQDGMLWTCASTRGFVVVKFGAKEVEGARKWLLQMLKFEGSVERYFGERALLCLR